MVAWAKQNVGTLSSFSICCTGTTGQRVHEATGLPVTRFLSGPLGGDAEIGALVCHKKVSAVFFIVDPLTAHPHDPDIQGLMRLCNVHNVPLATNLATADALLQYLSKGGS